VRLSKFVLLLALVGVSSWASTDTSILEAGSHCVAYRVEKDGLLGLKADPVVGKNCDVEAQVYPEVGGLFYIEVNIPIRGFKSGDTSRDEDVVKTLRAEVKPEMTFRTKSMSAQKWRELFTKKDFELEGDLSIADKSYPIKITSHYIDKTDTAEVDGIAKVRFADFEISPPKVVGGLVAKTKPEFELHFHLLSSRILGADSIRLTKATVPATKE
jgi:hypothetical protein